MSHRGDASCRGGGGGEGEQELPRSGWRPVDCKKATPTESRVPPGPAGAEAPRKACPGLWACKAPRRRAGEDQKIVVSYLVLMPLLLSCPGSTIHGRLARVFCSDGSICFKTERLMPVIRYLYGGGSLHPNTLRLLEHFPHPGELGEKGSA